MRRVASQFLSGAVLAVALLGMSACDRRTGTPTRQPTPATTVAATRQSTLAPTATATRQPTLAPTATAKRPAQPQPTSTPLPVQPDRKTELPAGLSGFYLVYAGGTLRLDTQPGNVSNVRLDFLARVNTPYPVVLVRSVETALGKLVLIALKVGLGFEFVTGPQGANVTGVRRGCSAERAGLRPGDTLTAVDGLSVVGYSADDMQRLTMGCIGSSVELTILRGGQRYSLSASRDCVLGTDEVEFHVEEAPEGSVRLVPDVPLPEGHYCYLDYFDNVTLGWSGHFAMMPQAAGG